MSGQVFYLPDQGLLSPAPYWLILQFPLAQAALNSMSYQPQSVSRKLSSTLLIITVMSFGTITFRARLALRPGQVE